MSNATMPLFEGQLRARRDAGGALVLATIEVGEAGATYTAEGQYAWVEVGEHGGYFALAGRPGASHWELLVRPSRGAAHALAGAEAGATVRVRAASGPGFPCAEDRGRPLVVAMPAAALGVARPVLFRRLDEGDGARTTLLLAAHGRDEIPLADELEALREAGVRVVGCLSRERAGTDPRFADGYVQDVARTLFPDAPPTFYVAGGTKAAEGVRAAWGPTGARVVSNS